MKLTRRQKEVVERLIALNRDLNGRPIHYTELAEYIGVNRFTAYDMLKLLEEKGYVTSHYHITESKTGPGRSEIVFEPTEIARQIAKQVDEIIATGQWETMRESLLSSGIDDRHLNSDILTRILPTYSNPKVRYCAEFLAVIILRIQSGRGKQRLQNYLSQIFPQKGSEQTSHLSLMSGFAFGILSMESIEDDIWQHELMEHATQYQQLVAEMTQTECVELSEAIREGFDIWLDT